MIIGTCCLLIIAGTAAGSSGSIGDGELAPQEYPTHDDTYVSANTPAGVGVPEEPAEDIPDPRPVQDGSGNATQISPTNISPSATSVIQGEYIINRTPQTIGKVNITYNVTLPENVASVSVYLNDSLGPQFSVVSADGFSYNSSRSRWEASNPQGTVSQASLTYAIDANTTRSFFGGKDTIETNDWALIGFRHLNFAKTWTWYTSPVPEYEETASVVREGYVGADENIAFLGPVTTYQQSAPGQTITLVVPDAANPSSSPANVLGNLTAASQFLQVGDRDPQVTAFVAPEPLRQGGVGGGSSFWAQENTLTFVPLHEYVHTRQAWLDADLPAEMDSTIEWISEGSASYYEGYLPWELNGRTQSQRFRNFLATSQNSSAVLQDDDRDTAELKNYNKGRRVLGALDIRIRQNTDGNKTLATLFSRLNAKNGSFSYTYFRNEAISLTNQSTGSWLDNYTQNSSVPPIPQDIEAAYSPGSVSTDGLNVTNVTVLNDPIVEEDELRVEVEVENTGSSSVKENASLNVFANETRSVLGVEEQNVSVGTGETKEVVLTYETKLGDSGKDSSVVVQGVTETDSEGANDTAGIIALDLWNKVTDGDGELSFFDVGTAIREFHDDGRINGTEFTLRDVNLFALYYEKVNGRSTAEALHARDKAPENYRNMDKVFPSNSVEAGGNVWELNEAGQSVNLPETYTYNGEKSVADYLNRTGTTGIVIAQNDTVINETYYRGYNASSKATSWSVAKSFTSALTMRALNNESIDLSLEDNVTEYLPELNGSGYENVKVKHVLTMSSGAEGTHFGRTGGNYRNTSIPSRAYFNNETLLEQFSGYDSQFPPGTNQNYLNSDTAVLGLVLEEATGQQLNRYLEEEIWKPVGMEGDTFWLTDNEGTDIGMCCLNAKLRDYTRFGLLYLNEGRRTDTGKQIIPENLVNQSTQPQGSGIGGVGYGYSWWVPSENEFAAIGFNGQYIYVNETENVVITKTSTDIDYTSDPEHLAFFRAVSTLEAKETEKASFAVNITDTNSPVVEGDALSVNFRVNNTGDMTGDQAVTLAAGDLGSNSTNVTLSGGESTTETLTLGTGTGDAGSYTATVKSNNDTSSTSVTVETPATPSLSNLNIAEQGTGATITEGTGENVSVNVTNVGNRTGSFNVTLEVGTAVQRNASTVGLTQGQSQTVLFSGVTGSLNPGDYSVNATTTDDEINGSLTVREPQQPANFTVNITGTNSPVTEGETVTVDVNVTNTGGTSDTQEVNLTDFDGVKQDSDTVTLGSGESNSSITLNWSTSKGDNGTGDVTVFSENNSDARSVTVNGVNDAPTAQSQTYSVSEDGLPLTKDVVADAGDDVDDPDSDLNVSSIDGGLTSTDTVTADHQNTQVSLTASIGSSPDTIEFTPGPDINALDTGDNVSFNFDYRIEDDDGAQSARRTITVEVTGTNDAPLANSDSDSTTEDSLLGGSVSEDLGANDFDPDDPINVVSTDTSATTTTNIGTTVTLVRNSLSGNTLTVAPDSTNTVILGDGSTVNALNALADDESATFTFGYTIEDDNSATDTGTYAVTVSGNNDAPVTQDQTYSVSEDGLPPAKDVVSLAGDDVDDPLSALDVSSVGGSGSTSQTDTFVSDVGATVELTASVGSDPDTIELTPTNMDALDTEDGTVSFTFDYRIEDDSGAVSSQKQITVEVTGTNDPPVAKNDSASKSEDTSVTVDVIANDADVDDDQSQLDVMEITNGPSHGTAQIKDTSNDTIEFMPGFGATSDVQITYEVSDDNGATDTATLSVTVNGTSPLDLNITGTNSPVTEGETVEVTANATNTGSESETQTITLDVPGLGTDSTEVSLNGGSSTTETLSVGTGAGDAGEYTATVSSQNDTDTTNVTVEKPATSSLSNLDIAGQGTDATITEGTDEDMSATVTNVGDQAGSFNVTLEIGTSAQRNTSTGELGSEESQTLTFENVTGGLTVGEYNVNISTTDDEVNGSLTIQGQQQSTNFVVNITGTNSPVTEGDRLEVNATVENIGGSGGSQTVMLDAGALGTNSTDISLSSGESTTEMFSVGTGAGDAGEYTVTVSSDNDTDTTNVTVEPVAEPNTPPVASFTLSPDSPSTTNTVEFDASPSNDSDGSITDYAWNFGDGNGVMGQNVTHSYSDNGTFTVTLTVTDDDDATNSASKNVTVSNVPPSADFVFSPDEPITSDNVTFDSSPSLDPSTDPDGSIVTYEWDFGDGNTETGETVKHSYDNPGSFNVTLNVMDDDGATTDISQVIIVEEETSEEDEEGCVNRREVGRGNEESACPSDEETRRRDRGRGEGDGETDGRRGRSRGDSSRDTEGRRGRGR